MLAWGQYVVGIALVLLVLIPVFDVHPIMGSLIEISFEGGIGSATGLAPTFESLGFADARDVAVGMATVGLISGLVFGILIINWGVKKRKTAILRSPANLSEKKLKGLYEDNDFPSAGKLTVKPSSIEPLTLHLALIAAAVLVGYLIREALRYVEKNTWEIWFDLSILEHFPIFPLALIGGIIIQKITATLISYPVIDEGLIRRINGFALDFMVVSALASLSLTVIGDYIFPFLILAVAGICWSLFAFFFIARKIFPSYWFERGIGDLGQSMGMTALGLLMLKISDPKDKSPALEGFAYKQILFEPIVGGGLFTAASGPLIVSWGLVPVLILTSTLCIGWFFLGYYFFGKKKQAD